MKVKEHFGIDQADIKRSLSPQKMEPSAQEDKKTNINSEGKTVTNKSKDNEKKKSEEK